LADVAIVCALGYINLRRAELLDGRLDLQSAPGQGTGLSLTMPVGPAHRPSRRDAA
jgi:hypothetical protein